MKTATSQQFLLVSNEFGYPLYIALVNGEIESTDNIQDAERFCIEDTLSVAKLPYYKAVTGYNLTFEELK